MNVVVRAISGFIILVLLFFGGFWFLNDCFHFLSSTVELFKFSLGVTIISITGGGILQAVVKVS